jgi:hypothetical protein
MFKTETGVSVAMQENEIVDGRLFLILVIWYCFEFRISDFEFSASVITSRLSLQIY